MKIHKVGLIAVLAAATLLAYSPALFAQEKKEGKKREGATAGQREEMMKERLNKMAEDLKLTDAQKKKVETSLKEQGEKMRASRDDTSLSDEQRREKGRALREASDKKMKEILTPEQFEKWQKQRAEMRQGGGKKKRGEDKK